MSAGATKLTEQQRIRNLERALRKERLGLVGIALAFLKESPDPARLMARLERMVEAAAVDPRKAKAAPVLRDGLALIKRAMEQELGKPQGLFDPDVGHVPPDEAQELTELPADQPISLLSPDQMIQYREAGEREVRALIIEALRQGPATDAELVARYLALGGPPHKRRSIQRHRIELARLGRITSVPSEQGGNGASWRLTEQHHGVTS